MAEHLKDPDDRMLEALFAAEPIPDAGFSQRIVRRLKRRLWLRRMCLMTALAIGGAIALRPALAFVDVLVQLLRDLPTGIFGWSLDAIPSSAMLAGGALVFLLTVAGLRLLED